MNEKNFGTQGVDAQGLVQNSYVAIFPLVFQLVSIKSPFSCQRRKDTRLLPRKWTFDGHQL